jgi:hypothetical protein
MTAQWVTPLTAPAANMAIAIGAMGATPCEARQA